MIVAILCRVVVRVLQPQRRRSMLHRRLSKIRAWCWLSRVLSTVTLVSPFVPSVSACPVFLIFDRFSKLITLPLSLFVFYGSSMGWNGLDFNAN